MGESYDLFHAACYLVVGGMHTKSNEYFITDQFNTILSLFPIASSATRFKYQND